MREYLLIFIMFFCLSASAEVYKWVDADGNIYYSDKEVQGAEKVELSKAVTFTPKTTGSPLTSKQNTTKKPVGYTKLAIASPAMNETIHSDTGDVAVSINITPGLVSGHTITLYLDGKEKSKGLTQTAITLSNLNRGSHTLKASVLDENGVVLISSTLVIFHLKKEIAKEKTDGGSKDNSKAYTPKYPKDSSEEAEYDHDYSKDYDKDYSRDYDSSSTYEDGAAKTNSGIPSNKNNFRSGPSTYAPNYNQKK